MSALTKYFIKRVGLLTYSTILKQMLIF